MKAIKKFFSEFREFAFKSDALELAIAVIFGAALNSVVKSLAENILMPIISLFTGSSAINLNGETVPGTISRFKYWLNNDFKQFISAVISFLITAFCIFLIVKFVNRIKKKEEPKPKEAGPTLSEQTLLEIRDLLKKADGEGNTEPRG